MEHWSETRNAPSEGEILGPLDEVGTGGREYLFGKGVGAFRMFVIRVGDEVRGYVNRCPHYSLPLNHQPDQFLTRSGDRIMCRQHLALFALDDGSCLDGACEGEGLQPVPVHVRDGLLVIG